MLYVCGPRGEVEAVVMLEVEEAKYRRLAARRAEQPYNASVWAAFREMSVLSSHPRGFLFGHPEDPCLNVFDLNGQRLEAVCHDWMERLPLTLPNDDKWEELRSGMRSIGARMEIPERYPPFDRVFIAGDGGLVYRVPTRERIDMSRRIAAGRAGV